MREPRVTEFEALFRALSGASVEYVVVGGVAGAIHGAVRLTQDLDIVYRRTRENLERLAQALAPYKPYLRGAPSGLPFKWDARTLQSGFNFTLTTDLGFMDVLGEIAGGGTYEELLPHAIRVQAFGVECHCLDLAHLIQCKRAAGRPKDFEAIAELEVLLEEERQREG
jgi:hypothetical protein